MNVSVLIDELEARKDDYILVADVINMMADATNSAPDEVVKYLDAHNIDGKLILLYMDESYHFEPYNGHLLGLGNDANTTYFQKSDVMAFEPITKHGIFKDGSLYHINHLQRNSEDEYLTLDEVSVIISNEARINCDYDKIRDLARKKKITPCFYFNGYVCGLTENPFNGLSPNFITNPYTEIMTGYFTYRLLVEQIGSQDDYITLPSCEVGNEILIYRLFERQGSTKISYGDGLALFEGKPKSFDDYNNNRKKLSCIGFNEIRFSKQELDSYIASLTNTSQDKTPVQSDSDLLAKLQSLQAENNDLNSRLCTARNTYKQHQNEIKALKEKIKQAGIEKAKLIEQLNIQTNTPADDLTLQTILDESHDEHAPDLKHAVKLWIDLYINKDVGGGSHSAMANNWIYKNTGYENSTDSSPVKRLREITTPLKDFGGQRPKEVKK